MPTGRIEWAGVPFLSLGLHDGRMLRAPGLYGFVRRGPGDERVLLFVDQAEIIASAAGPSHPCWDQALALGMNELHVCLRARQRIDRLLLRHHLIKRAEPLLNLLGRESDHAEAAPLSLWAGQRR
jgi:hypothetical protein